MRTKLLSTIIVLLVIAASVAITWCFFVVIDRAVNESIDAGNSYLDGKARCESLGGNFGGGDCYKNGEKL